MRCDTGIPPKILLDQHLIAEYRELLIPFGQIRAGLASKKSIIPERLSLGPRRILFWRNKQLYLKRRHDALVREMLARGFKPNYSFWNLNEISEEYKQDLDSAQA